MLGAHIAVLTSHRQTRRQISRALHSGGIEVQFLEDAARLADTLASPLDLLILDCDNTAAPALETALSILNGHDSSPPVVLLSIGADKKPLIELIQRHDISNLVAKHGAIRAVYPVLDERELLVTCEKVIRRDIFGIDKYVGAWGVVVHHATITSTSDKKPFLAAFEEYLTQLDCPHAIIPAILTVAEELVLNAVVHAPHDAEGNARYEQLGPAADLVLEPNEYVNVAYGCDGQRLMLSVSDNFGRLNKSTLYTYLSRGFEENYEVEVKASGAGLGLSLSFRSIHQLIFNIHETKRTEVIAGWYLRINSASEFRAVGKSLNLFWLPAQAKLATAAHTGVLTLKGRIDENTEFGRVYDLTAIDLRGVNGITSRGIIRWLNFLIGLRGRVLEIHGFSEPLIEVATHVKGMLAGVTVKSVVVTFECSSCGSEQLVELAPEEVPNAGARPCVHCAAEAHCAVVPQLYAAFLSKLGETATT